MRLRDFESDDLLLALRNLDTNGEDFDPAIRDALIEADESVKDTSYTVSAFLPSLRVFNDAESRRRWLGLRKRRDRPAQVYVVTLGLDLTGFEDNAVRGHVETESGAAVGLPDGVSEEIFESVSRTASSRFRIRSTPIFHNIRDGESLPLLGNGILLYGPTDPKGLLGLHVAVMEDDKAYRSLGRYVEETAKQMKIDELIEAAIAATSLGNPVVRVLSSAFKGFVSAVISRLKQNEDDVIQQLHFSSLAHQGYKQGVVPFERRNAEGHLLIDVQAEDK